MKIAIPLDENQTDLCVSFGRAPYFLFAENGVSRILPNPAAEAESGAGLQAAQFAVDQGAQALITVRCGENAAQVFRAAQVEIYKSLGLNAEENLKALETNQLEKLTRFHAGYHGIR